MSRRRFLNRTSKFTALAFGGIAFTLSINSCKNDGTKKPKPLIRLQSPWINDAEFIGYFIAFENGYYEEEGIDFKYLPGGPEIVSDSVLLAKNAEIALTTPDVTINSILTQKDANFKIIGAQYQKSPLGIVSLEKNGITKPADLKGKTLAVPPANQLTIKAFLKINNISEKDISIVPYQYNPSPLLNGEVDATLDFITNVPYTIKQEGGEPTSFLLYDHGFQLFNDTVVVNANYLRTYRDLLVRWLRASRKGWDENFKNPEKYVTEYMQTYFKGTGRTLENEIYYNKAQEHLMQSDNGIFSMSEESIQNCMKSLSNVGISAKRDMFINDLI